MAFNPLNYLGNILTAFRGKDNYTQTPVFHQSQVMNGKNPLWISLNDEEGKLYNTTVELKSVILKKASMYSNGVWKHYKMVGDKKEEIINSDVVALLENPNPLQSRNEWLMEEMIHTSLYGASIGYALKGSSFQEVPTALYNLPPNNIKVIPTGKIYKQSKIDGIIKHFELWQNDGTTEIFETKDVIYSMSPNPQNPILPISPLLSIQMALTNIRGAYGYRNVLINERGAIGMISNDTKDSDGGIPLSNEEQKRIANQYTKDHGTRENQSKVIVTSSSLKWTPFTYPTKDLMLFEEITANFQKIIDLYQMKKELFSEDKGSTFSNLIEAKRMTYQDAVIPYAENFSFKLSNFLGLSLKNEWVELDYSHIEALQENQTEKANAYKMKSEAYTKLKESGDFTSEELKLMLSL